MTTKLPPTTRKILLEGAMRKLAPKFGVGTQIDLLNNLALRPVNENPQTASTPPNTLQPEAVQRIMQIMFDDALGAKDIKQIIAGLTQAVSGQQEGQNSLRQDFRKSFDIIYNGLEDEKSNELSLTHPTKITEIVPATPPVTPAAGSGSATNPPPTTQTTPTPSLNTASGKSLSTICINTSHISFTQRMNNVITLFMNGIPNIDLNQITPYLEVTFNTPREPTVNRDGKQVINGMSLMKFLVGAGQLEDGSPNSILTNANKTTGPRTGTGSHITTPFTAAGMELFTSPQSLVNANHRDNPALHSNRILDKFQPFMSLLSVELSVVPTRGLMSNKTGHIQMKLHDRSRLADVAEFIRPEYYGANEIIIEYGWFHPQGEIITNNNANRNYVADLLNGMRMVEKYQVINSSFNMTDNGEVEIKLTISMRGVTDLETETILSNDEKTASSLRSLEQIQSTIVSLRRSIFGENNSRFGNREIRGTQFLDAAGDATHHLFLTAELTTQLEQLKTWLGTHRGSTGNPDVSNLLTQLDAFKSAVNTIRGTNAELLAAQISKLTNGEDPCKESALYMLEQLGATQGGTAGGGTARSFSADLASARGIPAGRGTQGTGAVTVSNGNSTTKLNERRRELGLASTPGSFSLAKLMLLFVGLPLIGTGKFDDVQLIYYPFNANAAAANRLNTGEFIISADLFLLKFQEMRLNTLGQSSNLSLADFINWLAATFFDDPANPVYGLHGLYRRTFTEEDGLAVEAAIGRGNEDEQNERHAAQLNARLTALTPNGEFRVPQIEFFIESLPGVTDSTTDTTAGGNINYAKTILKIHIFDRLNSPYESLQAINKAQRDTSLAAIGQAMTTNRSATASADASTTAPANEGRQARATRLRAIEAARSAQRDSGASYSAAVRAADDQKIIEIVEGSSPQRYRLAGGVNSARNLKEFFKTVCPYIIYGTAGSVIKTANLSSMQDSRLTTVNFLRSHTASPLEPNGENPGGLPMQIIPASLEMDILGCPFFHIGQTFFVDFNTGTTADNFYSVVNVSHAIGPGEFSTKLKLSPTDGYGQYINILGQINNFQAELRTQQPSAVGENLNAQQGRAARAGAADMRSRLPQARLPWELD